MRMLTTLKLRTVERKTIDASEDIRKPYKDAPARSVALMNLYWLLILEKKMNLS